MSDSFWANNPSPVLMVDSVLVMEAICSHGKHKVLAEEVKIAIERHPFKLPIQELNW